MGCIRLYGGMEKHGKTKFQKESSQTSCVATLDNLCRNKMSNMFVIGIHYSFIQFYGYQ